jgi:hypothetical protein
MAELPPQLGLGPSERVPALVVAYHVELSGSDMAFAQTSLAGWAKAWHTHNNNTVLSRSKRFIEIGKMNFFKENK